MIRSLKYVGAVGLLLATVITPASARGVSHPSQARQFSVGLVTDVGGLNDRSFNHLAYVGLQRARAQSHVGAFVLESRAEAQYVPNLTFFAQQHRNLTIGVGFLMESAIYQVARQYPNQKFALIDGAPQNAAGKTQNLPNVANLFFKEQESGYLVGVIAGLMESRHVGRATHGVIGVMGGVSIPPVNRYIAGYIAGAHRVDPGIRILKSYSQSFTNQSAGNTIGLSQIGQGADILFQVAGSSGLGYLAAAQQRGKYGIGVDADQHLLGSYVITSALKKVDVAVALLVKQTKAGHFRGGDHLFSLANNATGFAPVSSAVPASIVAVANHYAQLIRQRRIVPPATIAGG